MWTENKLLKNCKKTNIKDFKIYYLCSLLHLWVSVYFPYLVMLHIGWQKCFECWWQAGRMKTGKLHSTHTDNRRRWTWAFPAVFVLRWVADLKEAEIIFAVFHIHLFWVEVTERPAERLRQGLLQGLQLRRLAARLQHAERRSAAVAAVFIVPLVLCFVAGRDTASRGEDQLPRYVSPMVACWRSEGRLSSRRESDISGFLWQHCF